MILQSLYEYYERKSELGEIAPIGFESKPIPFVIVIDSEGRFKSLKDTRERKNKKLMPKTFLVPKTENRPGKNSWQISNLLWDHYGYVLGYPKGNASKDRKKRQELLNTLETENPMLLDWKESKKLLDDLKTDEWEKLERELELEQAQPHVTNLIKSVKALLKAISDGEKQLGTFNENIKNLPSEIKSEFAIQAILKFYEKKEYENVLLSDNWMDCAGINGANLTFQIEGETHLVLSKKYIRTYQQNYALSPKSNDEKEALCIVTGKRDYIERIHDPTPLIGGQAAGKLVGFQKQSGFDSYGKEQAFNAPIGRYAQVAYTTALNTLSKSDKNRTFVGDTTVMFWSEKPNIVEDMLPMFFTKPKDNPDKGVEVVKQFYRSIQSGKISLEDKKKFYVLGLSPNAARISVRYWLTGTVGDFAKHIKSHFDDLEIICDKEAPEFFALTTMLSHTVLDYKLANVIPNLAGQVTEAALKGTPYPKSLFHSVIRRIRAEQGKKINNQLVQNVTRVRASIIKACINRFNRFHHKNKEEITVSLDKTNRNPAYLLGRLFAVLERIQWKALSIETIRERYYGAFSSAPVTVYPQLMKLKNHHLAKLESSKTKNFFESLIGEIIDGLDGTGIIPRQFSLDEQGRFAVGYYHQRQDLKYKAKTTENDNETLEENSNE